MIATLTILTAVPIAATLCWHRLSKPGRLVARAKRGRRKIHNARNRIEWELAALDKNLASAADNYRKTALTNKLSSTPITSLRSGDTKGVRWGILEGAGIRTVADLLNHNTRQLNSIPGVGPHSVILSRDAAVHYANEIQTLPTAVPGLSDLDQPGGLGLFTAAYRSIAGKEFLQSTHSYLTDSYQDTSKLLGEVRRKVGLWSWIRQRASPEQITLADAECHRVEAIISQTREAGYLRLSSRPSREKIQVDLLRSDVGSRYAQYAAVISTALERPGKSNSLTRNTVRGGLPEDIASRIESHPLDATRLRLTLRSYQAFGAKFLLQQRGTLLGDEMGLGKTIQALAAMIHLDAQQPHSHFVVVCPASIIPNWCREIDTHTPLACFKLHGNDRTTQLRNWIQSGGIAVTSYGTLRVISLDWESDRHNVKVAMLTVDEAHYVKNRLSGRSKAVCGLASISERVCLMTGTPLENKIEEFTDLIDIVAPSLADDMRLVQASSPKLARLAAPAYLRRNQEDVLTELPERIEISESVELTKSDRNAYDKAVMSGNYMQMRQATNTGDGSGKSAKFSRIHELIEQYKEDNRKVLVFSFFLDTLAALSASIPNIGVLQGSVGISERMTIVDHFQNSEGHTVLLSQILAGGVGLNLQAASAVILVEPQWKPSTEDQAIARAHRMGQTRNVLVHRMIASRSVDEHLIAALDRKRAIFDRNVRESDLKEASSEASEASFIKATIAAEKAAIGNRTSA